MPRIQGRRAVQGADEGRRQRGRRRDGKRAAHIQYTQETLRQRLAGRIRNQGRNIYALPGLRRSQRREAARRGAAVRQSEKCRIRLAETDESGRSGCTRPGVYALPSARPGPALPHPRRGAAQRDEMGAARVRQETYLPQHTRNRGIYRLLERGAPQTAFRDRRHSHKDQRTRHPEGTGIYGEGAALGRGLQVQGGTGAEPGAEHRLPGGTHGSGDSGGEPRTGAAFGNRGKEGQPAQRRPDGTARHKGRRLCLCGEGRGDNSQNHRRGALKKGSETAEAGIPADLPRLRHPAGARRGRGQVVLPEHRRLPYPDQGFPHPLPQPQGDERAGRGLYGGTAFQSWICEECR